MRKWKKLLSPLRENRGSGVVLVLISMLFVSILGATLLYMSYIGFQMKVAERQGKQTFYDAAAAMSEIEAGVQQVVTDSIANAYNAVLVHYSDPDYLTGSTTMTQKFQSVFQTFVYDWSHSGMSLVGPSFSITPAVLSSFLSSPGDVTVSAGSAVFEAAGGAGSAGRIVLKNVEVALAKQPSDTRYTSRVKADIVIDMPDFYYLTSEYSISGIPQFAVIAKESLLQNVGNSTLAIDGSAYAGSMALSGTSSTFTITNGVMICAGDLSVTDGGSPGNARLTVDSTVSLWTGGITVNSSGSVNLKGTTYVADDLALDGSEASASLSGSYFGFGDSIDTSNLSSSIIVNGRSTTLNMTGLSRLMLAGHAFISESFFPSSVAGADVMMGESLAVKSNQKAYLIPAENLVGTTLNPLIDTTSTSSVSLDLSKPILGTKTPADYGMSLKHVALSRGSNYIHYYFMKFSDAAKANQYYADYFALHQDVLSANLALYTTLTDAPAVAQTAGYTVRRNGASYSLLAPVTNADYLNSTSAQLGTMFKNLCQTLTPTISASGSDPYGYIVNLAAVNALSGENQFFDSEDNPVAVIVNGDYVIDTGTPSTLKLVLATGTVSVNSDFTGLIIAGKNISINNASVRTVKADEENVVKAFASKNTADKEFRSFLNIDVGATVEGTAGGSSNWSLDQLVSLRNWSKD